MAELIVVGAGAAGLMAAGAACRLGHRVTVLEHSEMPGKKILVTGKGRCNVTNDCDENTFLQNVRTAPPSRNRSTSSVSPASETYSAGMRHKCPAQVNCQSTGTACAGAPWDAVQKFFP